MIMIICDVDEDQNKRENLPRLPPRPLSWNSLTLVLVLSLWLRLLSLWLWLLSLWFDYCQSTNFDYGHQLWGLALLGNSSINIFVFRISKQKTASLLLWCDKTLFNWIKAIFKEKNKIYENLRKRTASRLERGRNTTIHLFTILSMMCKAIVNTKRLWMQNNRQCNALNDIDHTRWLGVFIERVPPAALHHLNIYQALVPDFFLGRIYRSFKYQLLD